jgi:hypothetical protein
LKPATHALLASLPGHIECGRDALSVVDMRPVAYWIPAGTLAALWPLPYDVRPGPYVVDAGSVLEFRSYPEADHRKSVLLDQAGPDYMRVPTLPEDRLDPEGIPYVNRWAALV